MGTRVYIGNLSYNTDEASLRQACTAGGREVVSVNIITDRMTGQPRGFAFVEFANDKDAQAAITELHGKPLDGRTLAVNEAREREQRGGGGGGGGFGGGGGGGGRDRGGHGGGSGGGRDRGGRGRRG
jgi:cold-inducible RNA-binding protein